MSNEKLKTLIPIDELDELAQTQIYKNLELPFLEKMAIMPDCHAGYSLPIGAAALLNRVISPSYVGYDIGCGMCCVVTDIKANTFLNSYEIKKKIYDRILNVIPVGFDSHNYKETVYNHLTASMDKELDEKIRTKWLTQLGTLGGGNHFIEIGENRNGFLSVVIHSGSRNCGHSIADFYMKKSKTVDTDLPDGFFHLYSEWGQKYLQDMNRMVLYALSNRKVMMKNIFKSMDINRKTIDFFLSRMINETHNHAITMGDMVLHRKGATESFENQKGLIPSNMRDGTFIVKGLGNKEYLSSSSHGAGRRGSRKWAKTATNMDEFRDHMSGIVANVSPSLLDEAPNAYKDHKRVMELQEGIVIKTIDHIRPLINIKADLKINKKKLDK